MKKRVFRVGEIVWVCQDDEERIRVNFDPFSKGFVIITSNKEDCVIITLNRKQIRSLVSFLTKWLKGGKK